MKKLILMALILFPFPTRAEITQPSSVTVEAWPYACDESILTLCQGWMFHYLYLGPDGHFFDEMAINHFVSTKEASDVKSARIVADKAVLKK